jgi:cell division protease FtsH
VRRDEGGRRRLLELYGRGLDLRLTDPDRLVARMTGVTASFVKEVLRKAMLHAAEAERATVTDDDVDAVLDELLSETAALTRVLLGGDRTSSGELPHPHEWLGGVSGVSVDLDE